MTCAIVWRVDDQIHLASDSRLTIKSSADVEVYADVGVKVMSLDIGVSDTSGHLNSIFSGTYGFCYAGRLTSAATFKNFIEEILKDMQYVGDKANITFLEICKYIELVSSELTDAFREQMWGKEEWEFIVCGWCPLLKTQKAASFKFVYKSGNVKATFAEVVIGNGEFVVIGQGTGEVTDALFGQQLTTELVLRSLYGLIQNSDFHTVGGDIQYGTIQKESCRFYVWGIVLIWKTKHIVNGGGVEYTEIGRTYCYRGLRPLDGELMTHPLYGAVFPLGITWFELILLSNP